jgi:hypothetical protein
MRRGADKESIPCERVVSPLQDDETGGSKGLWVLFIASEIEKPT